MDGVLVCREQVMKKIILLAVLLLNACVVAGEFPENRNRLHSLGQDEEYCQKNPDKCVNNVPW